MTASIDVMLTALEGGIGYWADVRNVIRDAADYPLSYDVRPYDGVACTSWITINPSKIDVAVRRIMEGGLVNRAIMEQFVGWPDENVIDYDVIGADCAVQVAAFGEIIYG